MPNSWVQFQLILLDIMRVTSAALNEVHKLDKSDDNRLSTNTVCLPNTSRHAAWANFLVLVQHLWRRANGDRG
jgi:hypothetical protein